MKKNWALYFVAGIMILLSLLAAADSIASVIFLSKGWNPPPWFYFLDSAYGIINGAFDRTLGIPLFFLYFMGLQTLVPLALGISAFFLMRLRGWARKIILVYAWISAVIWGLEMPQGIKLLATNPSSGKAWLTAAAFAFYSVLILYLMHPSVKKMFSK